MAGILISAAALALAVLALLGWYLGSRRQADLERALAATERRLELLQQAITGLTAGAVGLDKRMRVLEAQERVLSERQQTIENQQAPEQPYSEAIRLVHQGAGVRRLMEELQLSESEAELITRLHGVKHSA